MTRLNHRTWERNLRTLCFTACAALLLFLAGCKRHAHTSDPHLGKIDDLLDAQLPADTPRFRVEFFLSSRGFPIQDSPDKSAVIAVIRQVDTDTLQPVTARVTFHFDPNDKLTSYDLQAMPNAPLPP